MLIISSQLIKLHGVADSLQGGRAENQDDLGFLDTPLGFLFVICDGMGGGPGGKTASYMAKCIIAETVKAAMPQAAPESVLRSAVSKAHEALVQKMQELPALAGMGSTLVAILINGCAAYVAHLGDSRCYHIHGSRLLFRTKDHSLVGELVQRKLLTEEQARVSPQSNVISRGLGSTSNHIPEIAIRPYRKGDKFIACTDGVWGSMNERTLLKRFTAKNDNKFILNSLSTEIDAIGKAEGGHHDNHTMCIIEMDCHSLFIDKCRFLLRSLPYMLGGLLLLASIVCILNKLSISEGEEADIHTPPVAPFSDYKPGSRSEEASGETGGSSAVMNSGEENDNTGSDSSSKESKKRAETKEDTTAKEISKEASPAAKAKKTLGYIREALENMKKVMIPVDASDKAKPPKAQNEAVKQKETLYKEVVNHIDTLIEQNYIDRGKLKEMRRYCDKNIGIFIEIDQPKDGAYTSTSRSLDRINALLYEVKSLEKGIK